VEVSFGSWFVVQAKQQGQPGDDHCGQSNDLKHVATLRDGYEIGPNGNQRNQFLGPQLFDRALSKQVHK